MKAIGNNVIVKQIQEETEEKIGSLFVPGSAATTLGRGKVISIGEGASVSYGRTLEPEVGIGDMILFHMQGSIPISIKGEEHLIMQVANVILRED